MIILQRAIGLELLKEILQNANVNNLYCDNVTKTRVIVMTSHFLKVVNQQWIVNNRYGIREHIILVYTDTYLHKFVALGSSKWN